MKGRGERAQAHEERREKIKYKTKIRTHKKGKAQSAAGSNDENDKENTQRLVSANETHSGM